MDDRVHSAFGNLLDAMPEPPTWEEVSSPTVRASDAPISSRRRPLGIWVAVATAVVVLVAFASVILLSPAADRTSANGSSRTNPTGQPMGSEYSAPDHSRLRFTQELKLFCDGLETVDNGGFDSFVIDIWIDPDAGYARLGIDYPDGSTYDLILQGRPGNWSRAWGSGTDLGRNAGCRETYQDGSFDQSIAGWAFFDSSTLFFEGYLRPVISTDEGIIVDEWRGVATLSDSNVYVFEEVAPSGARHRVEYTLDQSGVRLAHEERYGLVQTHFEERGTIEVLESGPATLPDDIFSTSTFAPLWGDVITTTMVTG